MTKKRQLFRKSVACTLIAAMLNPALIAPAFARDSDIYLMVTTGSTTAEPNVLFILGTNDRMNAAEAWREYPPLVNPGNPSDPLNYDSHAEYLWNDTTIIGAAEVTAESANAISDQAPPVNPFSPWGTWSGNLGSDRKQLWQATLAWAQGTQTGDPGPRSQYRNYWDGSWFYWLPTGTSTGDPRLWSISFNRFRGAQQIVAGTRGGITFPGTTANYNAANNFTGLNVCANSPAQLTPSTIFAPSNQPTNAGFMLNTEWVRWNPYLDLNPINTPAVNYPGNNTTVNGAVNNTSSAPTATTFVRGYVDGTTGAPTATSGTPGTPPTDVYRDSLGGNTGTQGQPIRVQQGSVVSPTSTPTGTTSYAGWETPKADMGGFIFQSYVATSTAGYFYPQTALANLRTLAYSAYPYNLGASGILQVPGGTLANEQFSAWLGNRHLPPTFDMWVGTPGYYDVTVTMADVNHSCDPINGYPAGGAPPVLANRCIQFSGGASTYVISQPCTAGGTIKKEIDASNTTRYTGTTCVNNGGATCTVNGVGQAMGVCTGAPANLTAPNCAPSTNNTFYTTYVNTNCSYGGGTLVTVNACQWTGRQSVYIEGQGTYFYGGTCGESGYNWGQPNATCTVPSGASPYNATKTLNGVSQSNVLGPYSSPAPANGLTTLGCGNTIAAGNYRYGGTCSGGVVYQEPAFNNSQVPGSLPVAPAPNPTTGAPVAARQTIGSASNPVGTRAAICAAPSGGTAYNIRNTGTQTYNSACNNNYSNVISCTGWYGGTSCNPNSTAASNCPSPQTASVAAGASVRYYQAYLLNASTANFTYECLGDSGNPGGGIPTRYMRTFAQGFNLNNTANASTNLTQPYTTNGGHQWQPNASKNIDVYSVNYLNFLYGAKACRDSSGNLITAGPIGAPPGGATCVPIARKTRLQVAKDALSGLVATTNSVRLGLMVYNKTDTTTMDEGGNVVFAIRRMGSSSTDLPAYNNRQLLINAIQGVTASSRTPLTETMYEAYLYFAGRAPVFGTLATTAAVGGAVSAGRETTVGTNVDPPDVYGNVYLTNAGGTYNSPMLNNPSNVAVAGVGGPAACQKNYIVMITNGQPEEDFSANAAIKTMEWKYAALGTVVSPNTSLDSNGGGPTSFNEIPTTAGGNPYGPQDLASVANDGGYIWLDELTYFMANADVSPGAANYTSEWSGTNPTITDQILGKQNIVTYTIGFAGVSAPVVQNAAQAATGVYYIAQNAQQLQSALTAAFVAITQWNPTAASATVPISSLNRGESSTDIYLSFFGPTPVSTWPGTVKKYQLSNDPTKCGAGVGVCLIGQTALANNNNLYNIAYTDPVTGNEVVDPSAVSGPNSDGTAWYNASVVDGASADKGGTGYVMINTAGFTPATRNVYTFLSNGVSSSASLTAANNAVTVANVNITAAMVNAVPATQRSALINFIRGADAVVPTNWQTWPHFAAEHARPAVVTYDATQTVPIQRMFYVQTNGMLTAVDPYTGLEKWSFLIEEALPQLPNLMAANNGPEIYVADGSPSIFFDDENGDGVINGPDRVWLFFGLRRGGNVYYALDITAPDSPIFKWKVIGGGGVAGHGQVCIGTGACTTNGTFDQLGQAWSTPQIVNVRPLGASPGSMPAIVFGGGYDAGNASCTGAIGDVNCGEDAVPAGTRTMGRALYVLNGNDATLVQSWGVGQAGTYNASSGGGAIATYAIPSDVTAINTAQDAQGFIDRIYVGDLGGNVWRFDVSDASAVNWKAEQLASLSNGAGEKRKFFFPPAAAPQSITASVSGAPVTIKFDAVYIGSGDKEHPTLTQSTTPAVSDDKMFMIMDDPSLLSGGGTPSAAGASALTTPVLYPGNLLDATNTGSTGIAPSNGMQGWFFSLQPGEKCINQPTSFFNVLSFGTYAPLTQLNACTPLGEGRLNQLNSLTGALTITVTTGLGGYSRWFTGFLSRGYMSTTQLITLPSAGGGKVVYRLTCADGICQAQQALNIGAASKIYWYMEPEQ